MAVALHRWAKAVLPGDNSPGAGLQRTVLCCVLEHGLAQRRSGGYELRALSGKNLDLAVKAALAAAPPAVRELYGSPSHKLCHLLWSLQAAGILADNVFVGTNTYVTVQQSWLQQRSAKGSPASPMPPPPPAPRPQAVAALPAAAAAAPPPPPPPQAASPLLPAATTPAATPAQQAGSGSSSALSGTAVEKRDQGGACRRHTPHAHQSPTKLLARGPCCTRPCPAPPPPALQCLRR